MLLTLLLALGIVAVALPWGAAVLALLARTSHRLPARGGDGDAGGGGGHRPPARIAHAAEEGPDPPAVVGLALVGLAALAAGAALWSLAGGLGAAAFAAAAAGAAGLALARPAPLIAALRRERAALAAAGLVAVLALAAGGLLGLGRAATPIENYDTGAYHAQTIRWLEEHGVVHGLGNLHSRLALSAGWFTPSALFSLAWLGGPSYHALNAAFYLLLLSLALGAFADWRAGRRGVGTLLRMALPPAGLVVFGRSLSSPSPDVAVGFLAWTAAALFLDAAERGELAGPPGWRVLAVAVLAGFASGIKLSALPLALLPLWLAGRQIAAARPRAAVTLVVATVAAAVPFVLQTVVASGYLVFPLPGLDVLDVDWKVPRGLTEETLGWIESWARVPHRPKDEVLAMAPSQWVPLWWEHKAWASRPAVPVMLAILVLVPVRLAWAVGRRLLGRAGAGIDPDRAALATAVAAGVAFWFLGAPDPRFGWGFLLLALLLLALPLVLPLLAPPEGRGEPADARGFSPSPALSRQLSRLARPLAWPRLPRFSADGLAAVLLAYFLWHAWQVHSWEPAAFRRAADHAVTPADYPVPPTRRVALRGFATLAPLDRDLCWYRPFPCTPFPDPDIELRGAGLRDGFRFARGAAGAPPHPRRAEVRP